jgi:ankyrin repeat protein
MARGTSSHKTMAEMLLKKGANVNSKDIKSETAVWLAASEGHESVVRLLLGTSKVVVNSAKHAANHSTSFVRFP